MNDTNQENVKERKIVQSTDVVLQEIWRIKDEISAKYGHDLDRFFADLREGEKLSDHPVVDLSGERKTIAGREAK